MHGIDVDLLKTFGRYKVKSLEELREKVSTKAMKLLTLQINRSTTFFLDTDQMHGISFESLIPQVKKQRAQEFTDLGDKPSHSKAVKTYYGFSYLTSSFTEKDKVALAQLSEDSLEFTGKRSFDVNVQLCSIDDEDDFVVLTFLSLSSEIARIQSIVYEYITEHVHNTVCIQMLLKRYRNLRNLINKS